MKLKVFDKVMLALIILAVAVLCVGLIVVCWSGLFDFALMGQVLASTLNSIMARIVITIVCLLLAFLCIRILFVRKRLPAQEQQNMAPGVLISAGENGNAYITVAAVEAMALKKARSESTVRECSCKVYPMENSINISMKVVFAADCNIAEQSAKVQNEVKQQIESLTGISVQGVQLLVESAAPAAARVNP
jgi:uncharacterized alkaline shock family protein YloU